jgi:hypothetical protein
MAERDIGSTFMMPQSHLYRPARVIILFFVTSWTFANHWTWNFREREVRDQILIRSSEESNPCIMLVNKFEGAASGVHSNFTRGEISGCCAKLRRKNCSGTLLSAAGGVRLEKDKWYETAVRATCVLWRQLIIYIHVLFNYTL